MFVMFSKGAYSNKLQTNYMFFAQCYEIIYIYIYINMSEFLRIFPPPAPQSATRRPIYLLLQIFNNCFREYPVLFSWTALIFSNLKPHRPGTKWLLLATWQATRTVLLGVFITLGTDTLTSSVSPLAQPNQCRSIALLFLLLYAVIGIISLQ